MNNIEIDAQKMRILLYDLAKSLFLREPDMETCSKWKTLFSAFAQIGTLPGLASSSGNLKEILDKKGCKGVLMEYHVLFIDPYSKSRLNTTLSWYQDGRNFGPALVAVRQLMKEAGVEKESNYHEPEDSIEVLMDTMIQLIAQPEGTSGQEGRFGHRLFTEFLQPLLHSLTGRMEELQEFPFYQACASYLKAWLEIEQEFHSASSSTLL